MDENTWFNIALGIHMKIIAPAGNTAADKFGVILKINGKYRLARFGISFCSDRAVNTLPLLGREQQVGIGIVAHGHIVEIPHVFCAGFDHLVIKCIRGNSLVVFACVAYGSTEKAAVLFQHLHSVHRCLIRAASASVIVRFLGSLNRERKTEIAAFKKLLAKFVVNKSCVGERKENAVGVFLCKNDKLFFSDQRLAAREHKEMCAERFAFGYDLSHLVKRKI